MLNRCKQLLNRHKLDLALNGRIQTLLQESVKFLNFGELLWSCNSLLKVSAFVPGF